VLGNMGKGPCSVGLFLAKETSKNRAFGPKETYKVCVCVCVCVCACMCVCVCVCMCVCV